LHDSAKLGWITNFLVSLWWCVGFAQAYQYVCNRVLAISF